MIAWFLLGVGLLVAGLLLMNWFANAPPRSVLRFCGWTLGALVLVLVIFLGVTGRLGWALAGLAGLAPVFGRLLRALPWPGKSAGAGGGNDGGARRTSTVNSVYLRMTLDHVAGTMEGEVLKGAHAGKALKDLDDAALFALLDTCRAEDPSGVRLLETWLDRNRGPEWRQAEQGRRAGSEGGGPRATMTLEEARAILGVAEDADADAIKAAHRKLMQRLHPDHGGTDYLAGRINLARQVLLGEA